MNIEQNEYGIVIEAEGHAKGIMESDIKWAYDLEGAKKALAFFITGWYNKPETTKMLKEIAKIDDTAKNWTGTIEGETLTIVRREV